MKKVIFIASFLLSSYVFAEGSSSNFVEAPEDVLPRKINVLVWNMHKGSKKGFEQEYKQFAGSKDLILLQEATFNDPSIKELYRGEQEQFGYNRSISWGDNGVATLATAGAFEITPITSKVREFGITPKAMLVSKYEVNGLEQALMVVNVHAINFKRTRAFKRHLGQLRKYLEKHQGPILVAGDFNTWTKGRVEFARNFFKEFGMEEVSFDVAGVDRRHMRFVGVMDRVYTRGIIISNQSVPATETSDHRPMIFSMDFM